MKASLTRAEVAKHTAEDDLWVIVDHKVYDLSEFIDAHPGGSVVLTQVAGQDATQAFYNLHRHEVIQQYTSLCLGTVEGETPEVVDPQPGDLSQVPYGEPCWLSPNYRSPYYKDSHRKLQKAMRIFVEEHVKPEAQAKEKDGTHISQELINKMAETNVLAMRLGPGEHLHGRSLLGVMDGKDFDIFHDLVVSQELNRVNARGFQDGNMAGMTISLTAVQHWLNNTELKRKITEEVLAGKKKMSLAITEAFAGSDVAGLRTTAESSEDGEHYIINGTKKWITNGMFSDYFVTGCKTKKGFSVILVPRGEGVETKPIKTSYSAAAATTYIEFNNVKVRRDHVQLQPRTVDDGVRHEPLDAHGAGGVPQVDAPAAGVRQAAGGAAGDPAEAGQDDRAGRVEPGLAGAGDGPDEQAVVRGAGPADGRAHRPAQVPRDALGARDRRRRDQHLRRARAHAVGHGQGGRDVPPHVQVRRDPGRHGGDPGGPRGAAGDEVHAQGHVVENPSPGSACSIRRRSVPYTHHSVLRLTTLMMR
nr:acyl-coa dehydrogenase apdg [Quercus suber]